MLQFPFHFVSVYRCVESFYRVVKTRNPVHMFNFLLIWKCFFLINSYCNEKKYFLVCTIFLMTEIWIGLQNCNVDRFFLKLKSFENISVLLCNHKRGLSISISQLGDNNHFYDIYFYQHCSFIKETFCRYFC